MVRIPQHLRSSARRQRGAAALFVAIALIALMLSIGFALDLGRIYVARAELQKLATATALSTVRVVSGCSTANPASPEELAGYVSSSLTQNGLSEAQLADTVALALPGLQSANGMLRTLDTAAEAELADSVSVTLTRNLPPPIFPLLPTPDNALLRSTAYAAQGVVGRVSVGSELLALNSSDSVLLNSLLGGLLGSAVNLSVASYNNLLNANLTLLEIVQANATVATVEDLLNLDTSLPGALGLVSQGLFATGEAVEVAAGTLLNGLAGLASPPVGSIRLGDYLGVEPGTEESVAQLPVNALDLLIGLAQLANEGYAVNFVIPGLTSLSVPGITNINIDAKVKIGEPPQEALGRPGYRSDGTPITQARSSQVQIVLDVAVSLVPVGTFSLLSLNLGLAVDAAPATADLTRITCPSPNHPQITADVYAETSAAEIAVGGFDINDANPIANAQRKVVLSLLGLDVLVVDPAIVVPLGQADSGLLSFDGPFMPDIDEPSPDHTQNLNADTGTLLSGAVSSLLTQLTPNLVGNIPVLGLVLQPLLTPVINLALAIVDPLLTAVGNAVLQPLLDLLGVSIGSAEVTLQSAAVEQPHLIYLD